MKSYDDQVTLGELIEWVENHKDSPSIGLGQPHSYRGYYEDLAVTFQPWKEKAELVEELRAALNAVQYGWKGGEYMMKQSTPVWAVMGKGQTGVAVTRRLLEALECDGW